MIFFFFEYDAGCSSYFIKAWVVSLSDYPLAFEIVLVVTQSFFRVLHLLLF